jgi:hypothetical protein
LAGLSDAYGRASGGLACRDYSGQRIPCDKLFRDAANGYYSVLFVRTTGGMGGVGGEAGGVMASLGLSATRVNGQYIRPRMIRREEKIRSEFRFSKLYKVEFRLSLKSGWQSCCLCHLNSPQNRRAFAEICRDFLFWAKA